MAQVLAYALESQPYNFKDPTPTGALPLTCALQLLSSGTPMPLSREHGHTCSTPFILRHLHPTHEDYADASERVLRLATITHPQARHHLSSRVKHFLERPSLKQGVRPRKHHHPTERIKALKQDHLAEPLS